MKEPDVEKKEYPAIDLLRLFSALSIIAIHTNLFGKYLPEKGAWYIDHLLLRLAVPLFFCISGFFAGKNLWANNNLQEFYKKYFGRLFPPLLFWSVINMPFDFYHWCDKTSVAAIIKWFFQTVLFYPSGYMWFVWSCIIWMGLIVVVWKLFPRTKTVILTICSILVFTFILLTDSYYFVSLSNSYLAKMVRIYFRVFYSNRILYGLPFLWIGILVYKANEKNKALLPIVLGVFLIGAYFETGLIFQKPLFYNSEMLISYLGIIPSLLIMGKEFDLNVTWGNTVRRISSGLYFTQGILIEIFSLLIKNNTVLFLTVVTVGVFLSLLLGRNKKLKIFV